MAAMQDFKSSDPIAWCPGCGDFGILAAVKKALVKLGRQPKDILLVSGIGQAAKLPHYAGCNCFNGLHGRALPAAVAAKIANRELTVIVTTGDGDCYGEGGNHFLHNIRRNVDITVVVCNNQIYGLTKGQASPTTDQGPDRRGGARCFSSSGGGDCPGRGLRGAGVFQGSGTALRLDLGRDKPQRVRLDRCLTALRVFQ